MAPLSTRERVDERAKTGLLPRTKDTALDASRLLVAGVCLRCQAVEGGERRMSETEQGGERQQTTRREVLKKAAVVGAVAWTMPVIESVTTPAYAGSPSPFHTCCTCNCSGVDGRVVLQQCNPGLDSGACESHCRAFCDQQELFPETVGFSDCGSGTATCQPTALPGAEGTACVCLS